MQFPPRQYQEKPLPDGLRGAAPRAIQLAGLQITELLLHSSKTLHGNRTDSRPGYQCRLFKADLYRVGVVRLC